jgi:hypothetical protein
MKRLCYNKYSKANFLKKEKEIRQTIKYENESPIVIDFCIMYIKMIKYRLN